MLVVNLNDAAFVVSDAISIYSLLESYKACSAPTVTVQNSEAIETLFSLEGIDSLIQEAATITEKGAMLAIADKIAEGLDDIEHKLGCDMYYAQKHMQDITQVEQETITTLLGAHDDAWIDSDSFLHTMEYMGVNVISNGKEYMFYHLS